MLLSAIPLGRRNAEADLAGMEKALALHREHRSPRQRLPLHAPDALMTFMLTLELCGGPLALVALLAKDWCRASKQPTHS